MATFKTYRDGTGSLERRIERAVARFHKDRGRLPAAMIVHSSEVADARTAVQALKLALPVRGSGGCIIPEVWLELPKKGGTT